ncbi:CCHC-type integrase [Olea europaea subsp. europaea]|uniref:CCHC-type integrase, partial n=1 Tax=Olea europaea subsp. europaea TaxID=158383 RepID=A0A8S0VB99_OLEEU|nr:CCHC-type integrase [Olea europaea subsp. europaea]
MPLIAMSSTSYDAWQHLACLFASKSRARIMQLKGDLTLIQRGSRTVSEFLHAVKVIADELSLIDAPVSEDDLTLYVLNGLGPEFRDMVAPIRTHETALSFTELYDLLVGHEHYIKCMDGNTSILVVTANSSQRRSFNGRTKNGKHKSKPQFNNMQATWKSSVVCQFCDQHGHSAKNCGKLQSRPVAHCTTSSAPQNGKWLLDSAASHNITSDLANLSIHSEYDGQDEVVLGDGTDDGKGVHERCSCAVGLKMGCIL